MSPPFRLLVILLSSLFLPLITEAQAALTWESTIRTPAVALGAEKATAEFPFQNKGTAPVVILSLRASCGCTVPELEKRAYGPGESGVIKATFTIGDRQGAQHSVIYIQTDDPGAEALQLHLHLDVPQPLEITPRVVSWSKDEEPAAKQIEIQVHPEAGVDLTGVQTTDLGYQATLKPQAKPGRYIVEIVPTSTATQSRATFQLQTSKPLPKAYPVFGFVR